MNSETIAFIGAGNIATAIVGGLIEHGYRPAQLRAADPSDTQLARMPAGVARSPSNRDAVTGADVIVLCVKPNLAATIAADIADLVEGKLVISVAAGITTGILAVELGDECAIIRCMPNTPALVQEGMTGLFASEAVSDSQRQIAETILGAVGKVLWFDDEIQLDMVTAVSGSGPAYYFLVMEAMVLAASRLGLPADVAQVLVQQTALGAARMALGNEDPPAELRRKVTSPGGTTEAAINVLLNQGLIEDFRLAIEAAFRRSLELAGTPAK